MESSLTDESAFEIGIISSDRLATVGGEQGS